MSQTICQQVHAALNLACTDIELEICRADLDCAREKFQDVREVRAILEEPVSLRYIGLLGVKGFGLALAAENFIVSGLRYMRAYSVMDKVLSEGRCTQEDFITASDQVLSLAHQIAAKAEAV